MNTHTRRKASSLSLAMPCAMARHVMIFALALCGAGCGVFENPTNVEARSNELSTRGCRAIRLHTSAATPLDSLWVIDNSPSMCTRQQVLRANIRGYAYHVSQFDMHLAVTTTHGPEDPDASSTEPVARFGHLQATPQPVPSSRDECNRGEGTFDGKPTEFAPLRLELRASFNCLKERSDAVGLDWTDAQIACALSSADEQAASGCATTEGVPDRTHDGVIDAFDLFPLPSQYRALPKVLSTTDYRRFDGRIDIDAWVRDVQCLTMVGTRGDSFEKGLGAAIAAVSPALTGGAVGVPGEDQSAPNHGFLRRDAFFYLNLVSDENDCTHDGSINEREDACGEDVCQYYNSTALAQTPLVSPEELARQLRENFAASNHTEPVHSHLSKLTVTLTIGTMKRYTGAFPTCEEDGGPGVEPVCTSFGVSAESGDRYMRFAEQFEHRHPRQFPEFGWMCSDSYPAPFEALPVRRDVRTSACYHRNAILCDVDSDCPPHITGDYPGRCVASEVVARVGDHVGYCDTSIAMMMVDAGQDGETLYTSLEHHPYCEPGSLFEYAGSPACIVRRGVYAVRDCGNRYNSVTYTWNEHYNDVTRKTLGYQLHSLNQPADGWGSCPVIRSSP